MTEIFMRSEEGEDMTVYINILFYQIKLMRSFL